MTRLLLLVPTTSYRVHDFMAAAQAIGIEVTVGAERRQAPEALGEGRTLTLDFADAARGTEQIVGFARTHPLTAIVAADESATLLAAQAARALGLAHNAPDAVAAAGNKYAMRKAFAAAGLASPNFALVRLDADAHEAARVTPYPCVLKPLALSASRGVIRGDDAPAFVAAFARIHALLATAREPVRPDLVAHLLVESYIPGVEVALEGLLVAGELQVLALFDKPDALEGPYFEETIYVTPSRLAAPVQAEVIAAARRAAAALGLTEGPVHAEFRVNEQGVWVLEMAARSIGGLCGRTLRFRAGISLEELILRHALGLPLTELAREGRAAGVMMIPIPGAGTLRAVGGEIEARGVPGIEDVRITIPVGQPVVPLPEGDRYLGFLFARGEAPAAVERALREAHRRLHFTITP